jgi:hypothetical protein
MPQVTVNRQKWEEAKEGLELSRELAKQVLSQLSYTPMRCNQYPVESLPPVLQLVQLRFLTDSTQ